jgi:hypothetical protein
MVQRAENRANIIENTQWRVLFAVPVGVVSTESLLVGGDDGADDEWCGRDRFFWSTSGLDSAVAAEDSELLDDDFWWCNRASTKDWPLDGGDDDVDVVVVAAGSVAKAPLALADSVFGLVPKSDTFDCAAASAVAAAGGGSDAAVEVAVLDGPPSAPLFVSAVPVAVVVPVVAKAEL